MSRADTPMAVQAKKIPVPENGEIIKINSVELLCTWMKLNNLKVLRWQGNLLVTVPDKNPLDIVTKEKGS